MAAVNMCKLLGLLCLAVAASALSCSQKLNDLCRRSKHTMCEYSGPNCPGRKFYGLKDADKKAVIDAHNRLRSKVANGQESSGKPGPQPSAANMQKVEWDDELAQVAQRWADQCKFGHDACRSLPRFYVGQNAYQASFKGSAETAAEDWNGVVNAWYNEVRDFSRNSIKPFKFSFSTGHYSQVVWATTKKVGCGFTAFKGSDGWFNKYYVCNYGPGGNLRETTMYEEGRACSKCSKGCQNGLCL